MGIKITNQDSDRPNVWLYGVIGDMFGGVTADEFRQELGRISSKQAIDLHIHSEGGDFWDSVAMHAALRQRTGDTDVYVDGLAASGASLVAMAGKTVTMAEASFMMIHRVHAIAGGTANDLRKHADQMDVIDSEIVDIYSSRFTGERAELTAALDSETWFNGESAMEAGFADEITESLPLAAKCDVRFLEQTLKAKHVPEEFLARVNGAERAEAIAAADTKLAELLADVPDRDPTQTEEHGLCAAKST